MHDSGTRQKFATGAVRDAATGKPRPDLVSPFAEERIGKWMALGAEKYSERNWEAGIPISRCIASLSRHLMAYKAGKNDEDHLAAIAVNAQFIMHYEAMIAAGVLPPTLDDMPHYHSRMIETYIENDKEFMDSLTPGPIPTASFSVEALKKGDKVIVEFENSVADGLVEALKKQGYAVIEETLSDCHDFFVANVGNGKSGIIIYPEEIIGYADSPKGE